MRRDGVCSMKIGCSHDHDIRSVPYGRTIPHAPDLQALPDLPPDRDRYPTESVGISVRPLYFPAGEMPVDA